MNSSNTPDSTTQPRRSWPRRHKILTGLLTFAAVITLLSALANLGHHPAAAVKPAPAATAAPAHQAPAAPAKPKAATPAPAKPKATTPPPPAAPAGPTASQQQALTSAQGYLSDGQGFSQAGLIAQLDSPYGDKFSVADATWAVDHSGADWNAQAVIAAKGYLHDGQGFSHDGLISQLDSQYGGQFTYAQAAYGVGQAGL